MDYLWLKAIHVAAAIIWIGGMLTVAITTTAVNVIPVDVSEARRGAFLLRIRRWDRTVTTPAMLMVWAFGLALAVTGQWLSQPWLIIKIALVIVLSGIHGMLSGGLRRLTLEQQPSGIAAIRFAAVGILCIMIVVVGLVVIKPF